MRNTYCKTKIILFLVMLLCLLAGQNTCFAESVSLTWDANSESNLGGYKVYYKADSSALPFDGVGAVEGVSPVDAHNLTTATISGLDPAQTYYFAVTAYDTSGLESPYSNIVTVPASAPPAASPIPPATITPVTDTTAPAVSLIAPGSNSSINGTVTVTASASDDVGVSMVECYRNGTLLFASNVAPYTFNWNTTTVANGSHTLLARAYDSAGNIGQSATVSVTVNNPNSTSFTLSDALLALQIGSGKVTPTAEQMTRLDVAPVLNGVSVPNGVIDTGDAIVLLSKIVGKPVL